MKQFLVLFLSCVFFSATSSTLTERERAQHALDRLAFGGKPGDVEMVMRLGVDRWIEQQLHPERIPDRAVDAQLARYETLSMSSAQIAGQFKRRMKGEEVAPENRPRRLIAEL